MMSLSILRGEDGAQSMRSSYSVLSRAFLETEELPFPAQALAEPTAMFLEQFGNLSGGLFACPVALQFADIRPGGRRNGAGLDHARNGHVMCFPACAAG